MKLLLRTVIAIAISILFPIFAFSTTITGEFTFNKKAPKGVLIYVVGDTSLNQPAIIDQKNNQFVQPIVVGKKGTNVQFVNSDTINHNVYADDKKKNVNFDIGLALPGSSFEERITWEEGELVRISCKIHPKMRAWVGSMSSKYFQILTFERKQKQASFVIEGVPSGLQTIRVVIPGYDEITTEISVGNTVTVDVNRKKKKRGTMKLQRS